MKCALFIITFMLVCVQEYKFESTHIQRINKNKTPAHTLSDLIALIRAHERKDYVMMMIKAMDVYEDVAENDEPLPVKLAICLFRRYLYLIYPVYLTIYPDKRPKEATVTEKVVDSLAQSDFVQSASDAFLKMEDPAINNLLKLVF